MWRSLVNSNNFKRETYEQQIFKRKMCFWISQPSSYKRDFGVIEICLIKYEAVYLEKVTFFANFFVRVTQNLFKSLLIYEIYLSFNQYVNKH